MPSREEILTIIRKGIAHWIADEADNGYLRHWDEMVEVLTLEQQWDYFLGIADLIMADESKKGVVIKVDRELPKPDEICPMMQGRLLAWNIELKKAGCGFFEPLIDEEIKS